MCGIGLAWFREGVDRDILTRMFGETERRGRDAFGAVLVRGDEIIDLARFPVSYSASGWKLPDIFKVGDIVIWNCRARPMTEKPSTGPSTIQPLVYKDEGLVVAHNGVVANEDSEFDLDTELFVRRYLGCGRDMAQAASKTVGGSAYLIVDLKRKAIIAARDFKPLAKAYVKGIGYLCLSDSRMFERILGRMDVAVWENFYHSSFEPFTSNEIDIDSGLIRIRDFKPKYVSHLPEPDPKKALSLASGGIDSSVAACIAVKKLGWDLTLCHFDHCQKSEVGERSAVEYLADFLGCDLKIIDLKWLGRLGHSVLTDPNLGVPLGQSRLNLKSTVCWTPARNLVMASSAMAIAESIGASKILNGWTLEEEGCLVGGEQNKVRLWDGSLRSPEEVVEGDQLVALDLDSGEFVPTSVVKVWQYTTEDLIRLSYKYGGSEQIILCTKGHHFYVEGVGWRRADELGEGKNYIRLFDGGVSRASIVWEATPVPVTVYDFTCVPHHNYCVNGVLSHNSYPDNSLDFFRTLNAVSDFGTLRRPRIVMLEANLMKPEIVRIGRYFGLDFGKLWSCDTWSADGECGKCGACTLKGLALEQERTLDPERHAGVLLDQVNLEEV